MVIGISVASSQNARVPMIYISIRHTSALVNKFDSEKNEDFFNIFYTGQRYQMQH